MENIRGQHDDKHMLLETEDNDDGGDEAKQDRQRLANQMQQHRRCRDKEGEHKADRKIGKPFRRGRAPLPSSCREARVVHGGDQAARPMLSRCRDCSGS